MIVMHGETLWSPAPQPMDNDDDDDCSTNLDIDKFQDNTEVLPILGYSSGVSPLGLVNFAKNLGLNYLFLAILLPIFLWAR